MTKYKSKTVSTYTTRRHMAEMADALEYQADLLRRCVKLEHALSMAKYRARVQAKCSTTRSIA